MHQINYIGWIIWCRIDDLFDFGAIAVAVGSGNMDKCLAGEEDLLI